MPNFSRINASKKVPYIHLSKTHGSLATVKISKTDAAYLGFQSLNVNVRALESRRIVIEGLNSVGLDEKGVTRGNIPVKDYAGLIHQKFSVILLHLKLEDLTKAGSGHSQKCFSNVVSVLENNLNKFKSTPWIKMTEGLNPFIAADEYRVKNYIKEKMYMSIFSGTASFLLTTTLLGFLGWAGLMPPAYVILAASVAGTAIGYRAGGNSFQLHRMLKEFDKN